MERRRHRIAAAVAALGAAVAAANAPDAAAQKRPRPDVAIVGVATKPAPLPGRPFVVIVTLAERTRKADARATVHVRAGATTTTSRPVTVRAGRRIRVGVALTLAAPGSVAVSVRARVPRDHRPRNNVTTLRISATDFALAPARTIVDWFGGFGAHFNQNVYAQVSRDAGVADENVADMEQKVVALQPHFARLFFHRAAFTDDDRLRSFVRAAQLAQRTGATIHVTWQSTVPATFDAEMQQFADVVADLLLVHGVTNLRWVTIQNEVNRTSISMEAYDRAHRLVAARLAARGVAGRVAFMGGDLVAERSPLGQTQADWFAFMATRMNDVLDAYSIHVFWDYWDTPKLVRRLAEVRAIYDALPASARKPLYVTEYGVRGRRIPGEAGPGAWEDGTPMAATTAAAFQEAWLALLATKLGYAGAVKWDAYFGRYDRTPQAFGMIGPPQEGWPLRPSYNLMRLLTGTTGAGWRTVGLDGVSGSKLVAGFAGWNGALTMIGLDTTGARGRAPATTTTSFTISGLPPQTPFTLMLWNGDGTGTTTAAGTVTTDASGIATVSVPVQAVFALTTLPLLTS